MVRKPEKMVNTSTRTRKNAARKNATRKTGGPATISELKKALGYSPRTRYTTMLAKPSKALQKYLLPMIRDSEVMTKTWYDISGEDSQEVQEQEDAENSHIKIRLAYSPLTPKNLQENKGAFVYGKSYVSKERRERELKKLVTKLAKSSLAERNKIAEDVRKAQQDQMSYERENEKIQAMRKRQIRENKRAAKRTLMEEEKLLQGVRIKVSYFLTGRPAMKDVIIRYKPSMEKGARWLMHLKNNKTGKISWYTMSLGNMEDLFKLLEDDKILFEARTESEEDIIARANEDVIMTISHPEERTGKKWSRRGGAFFSHVHDYDCEELTAELKKLGCFKEVDAENYQDNCLWHAFKSAGVDDKTLEALKHKIKRRTISRSNIKQLAEEHNLYITVRTQGDEEHFKKFGPEDGFQVDLALVSDPAGDHYIHYYKTKFNSFAINNYNEEITWGKKGTHELKDTNKWWTWKSKERRDPERGMKSNDLLNAVKNLSHCKPINIADSKIFTTQFHNTMSRTDFTTLDFEENQCKLCHEPRLDTPEIFYGDDTKEGKAFLMVRKKIALSGQQQTLDMLDEKFERLHFGAEEQLKALRRALNSASAKIAFDFEASPFDVHTPYCSSYKDINAPSEIPPTKIIGGGREFLDALLRQYGSVKEGNSEDSVVKKFRAAIQPQITNFKEKNLHLGCACCKVMFSFKKKEKKLAPNVDHCGAQEFRHLVREFLDSNTDQTPENFAKYHARHAALQMLCAECNNSKPKSDTVTLLAHNITYDFSFICPFLSTKKFFTCEKGVKIICGSAYYENEIAIGGVKREMSLKLRFQDSYMMISMPLSDFGKSFKLKQEKEVFPHRIMTKAFIKSGARATSEELKNHTNNKEDLEQIIANMHKIDAVGSDGRHDLMKYAQHYCALDVQVLADGWNVFRDMVLEKFSLDTWHYPTLAGLADQYFVDQGCFEGVFQLSCAPQAFIAQCTVGGRTMCANNKKQWIKGKIVDFDCVSLYPSAMRRLGDMKGRMKASVEEAVEEDVDRSGWKKLEKSTGGYLLGSPKVYNPEIHNLDEMDGYFLKIKVTAPLKKEYRLPVARIRTEEGGCNWTNDLNGQEIFVDRFTLEDLQTHCGIEYEIIQGYVFDEGRNNRIKDAIQEMFDERKRIKDEDSSNPMQLIIKLLMNSSYGKTGLKAVETDVKYVPDDKLNNFISNNYNNIKMGTCMGNGLQRVELYKEISQHFNRQHVACEILSVSKNIMNEVTCLAEDIGAKIFYTDTDSMHLQAEKVAMLAEAFREKHGRELIGKALGQCHSDFADIKKGGGEVWSTELIAIDKKTYIDRLRDEAGNEAFHIRMKGIPSKDVLRRANMSLQTLEVEGVEEYCKKHFKPKERFENKEYHGDPMKMFEDIYSSGKVVFPVETSFQVGKDHKVRTTPLIRTVQCKLDGEIGCEMEDMNEWGEEEEKMAAVLE